MNDRDALIANVCEAADPQHAILVLVDWLEEQGDPACEAWRWLARNEREPRRNAPESRIWFWRKQMVSERHWPHVLPEAVIEAMPLYDARNPFSMFRNFRVQAEAWEAAVQAVLIAKPSASYIELAART